MKDFNLRWASRVISHRLLLIIGVAILLCIAPLSFNNLHHDNSNEAYFLEHDPNLIAFDRLLETFGDPEYLIVGIPARAQDSDIFTAEAIRLIDDLTLFLEDSQYVTQVRSLSNYQYTHDDDGMMATDDLFEDISALANAPAELERARTIMSGEQLPIGRLITADFKHTQILARTEYKKGENSHKVALTQELLAFIKENNYSEQGFDIKLSGIPIIGERFETLTQNDMAWINPVMGVIMLIILFIIFRSFFSTLTPIFLILAVMLLVTSLQGLLDWPFTAVNSALIPTVIILAMGTSVHVLVEFFQFRAAGQSPQSAAESTVGNLFSPILFTCLTTSVGFVALSVTELSPVRQFALLAGVAPLIIFLLTTTLLPALLSYISWLPKNLHAFSKTSSPKNGFLTRILQSLPNWTLSNKKTIAATGVIVSIFSVWSVTQITVDANIVNYFKKDSWAHQDLHYFNETFKGISNLEIIIDSGEEGGVKNPEFLQRAESLQNWFTSIEEAGKPISVIDFYKQINQSLNENNSEYYTLPTTRPMAAQFLFSYENTGPNEDLSDMIDYYRQVMRIQLPIINMDATDMQDVLTNIENHIAENYSDLNIELTGTLVMNNAQNHYVNNGMFKSFGIAILVIGLCFLVLFRSFKYGGIALIPSIVPVLLTGGLVSFAGIAIDLGTMIVGAMTIGIAVDDSIHIMSRYIHHRKQGLSTHDAIHGALQSAGRAVVLTSIILISGFSVMLLGSFVSYIYVGLFSAMIMSLALIGDLIFMPALLYLFDNNDKSHSHSGEIK